MTPNSLGNFSTNSAWNELRMRKREVDWAHIVWHKKFILRHAVTLWLALKKRLNTRDKLVRYGVTLNSRCVHCSNGEEDINHFFFKCEYSAYIWENILAINDMTYMSQDWERYIDAVAGDWKGRNLKNTMGNLCIGATVYAIWKERNNRIFSRGGIPKKRIKDNVRRMTRDKGAKFTNIGFSREAENIACTWGLPCCIFKPNIAYLSRNP